MLNNIEGLAESHELTILEDYNHDSRGSNAANIVKLAPERLQVRVMKRIILPQLKILIVPMLVFLAVDYAAGDIPNDPNFGQQWGFNNTGQTGGNHDADIDAIEAWSVISQKTPAPVIVAVIDTGVDYKHPDLAANMWINPEEIPDNSIDDDENGYVDDIYGWDFANDNNDPMDEDGHGTHVAGIIAADTNNSIGGAGTAGPYPLAKIMALKFIHDNGSYYDDDAVKAIAYAAANGAKVINFSWDGNMYDANMYDAIRQAQEAGILFVTQAGNDGCDNDLTEHYPSNYDCSNILAVAASDHNDELANFSNYGATSVDLAAPGDDIFSTVPPSIGDGSGYDIWSGTSMATPHVSGAAALIYGCAKDMYITFQAVKGRILLGADSIPSALGKTLSGKRLNAYGAITLESGLYVNSPGGGETLDKGRYYTIEWASFDGGEIVDINLLKDGSFHSQVGTAIPNTGQYKWYVPFNLPPDPNYRIEINDANNVGQSFANFSIIEPTGPYLIYTAEQLNAIGADPNCWDKEFKLAADINLAQYSGEQFNIIGNNTNNFTGVFDGNEHTISNFTYESNGIDFVGLFGFAYGENVVIRDFIFTRA